MLFVSPQFVPIRENNLSGEKKSNSLQIQTICSINVWPVITVAGRANTSLLRERPGGRKTLPVGRYACFDSDKSQFSPWLLSARVQRESDDLLGTERLRAAGLRRSPLSSSHRLSGFYWPDGTE